MAPASANGISFHSGEICSDPILLNVYGSQELIPWNEFLQTMYVARARICKRLWRPGIDSKESMPLAYFAWRPGTTYRVCCTGPLGLESISGLHKGASNTGSELEFLKSLWGLGTEEE